MIGISQMIKACPACKEAWRKWMTLPSKHYTLEIVRGKVKGGFEFHLSLTKSSAVGGDWNEIITTHNVGLKQTKKV